MVLNDSENTTFQLASDFINKTSHSVFLTGKAGTGKTTFLKFIKENTVKNTAIVAPTGVASMNAGGTTIHSFFQLPFTPFIPGVKNHFGSGGGNDAHHLLSQLRLNAERIEILQQLDLLIIDEISMVRADVLDAIDLVLRHVRSQHALPFGGVQVLFIGDMYQLPPVIKQEEWQLLGAYYSGPFFFCSQVIAAQPPVYIELNKVYRQRDADFISLLNQVRNNEMNEEGYALLHSRYQPNYVAEENVITLTTHNAKADAINSQALAKIQERDWRFPASIEGVFSESAFPADESLQLKVGAQVMFIKNDLEKVRRYYNGKIGVVDKIEDDKVWVKSITGTNEQLIEIKKETWRNIKYTVNKKTGKVEEEELGSFTQFPLRLAWAITIHKSQGLTFEKVVIDAGNAFSPGQVYVALSRCTSLAGLHLVSKISYDSLRSDPRIVEFAKGQQSLAAQSALLQNATLQYEQEMLRSIFDFNSEGKQLVNFIDWVKEQATFNKLSGWLQSINMQWDKVILPGRKFQLQLEGLAVNAGENVSLLQERITAASQYFLKELNSLSSLIGQSAAITDNRALARDYDTKLQDIFDNISRKIHFIEGCQTGFSLTAFQNHRSSFVRKPLSIHAYSGTSSYVPADSQHPELYHLLKTKRDDICAESNLPVYMVCSSSAIQQMTETLPVTLHDLGNISGFGKVKLKQFGKKFINIIADYCEANGLESQPGLLPIKKSKKEKVSSRPDTKLVTYDLYNAGRSIADIAAERKLTIGTVEGHLAHYIAAGSIKVENVIEGKKLIAIVAARRSSQSSSITVLKDLLPDISYGELRLFLASEKNEVV